MLINEDTEKRGKVAGYTGTCSELYKRTASLSIKSFASYAKRIGVRHHYSTKAWLTKDKKDMGSGLLPFFEVLRIVYDPMYDDFDDLLFVDTDVIANTREDIFKHADVKGVQVAGVFENDIETANGGGYNSWDFHSDQLKKVSDKYARSDMPVTPNKWSLKRIRHPEHGDMHSALTVMNTGVMVWTKEARLHAREVFDDWYAYMVDGEKHNEALWLNNDQFFISGQFVKHGFDMKPLHQTWNDTPTHWHDERGYKNKFLHYTGGTNKQVMLVDHKEKKFKYI